MPKWEAAIATENPKILYRIVELLKKLEIQFVICSPVDHRCGHAHVVITGPDDNCEEHTGKIVVTEDFDAIFVQIEIIANLYDIQNPSRTVVGIDPGMTSGIALVIDGIPVYSHSSNFPKVVTSLTQTLIAHAGILFPESQKIIRIGTGSKLYSTLLLRSFQRSKFDHPIELVNEFKTTLSGGYRSDESAAILIAGRNGRLITETDVDIEPKAGYIRSLKKYVLQLTKGKKTITSREARALMTGEHSLEEIISNC